MTASLHRRKLNCLRVTFVTPYMRRTTGGVYTIEQFSRHLSRRVHVAVVSRTAVSLSARVSARLAGGRLSLFADGLPDADVLVVPADDPDGREMLSFPARKGSPVLFLQGFGRPPGAPDTDANLSEAERVVCVSRWLVEEARSRGCRAELVPPGLDRKAFFSETPAASRDSLVTIMTHSKDWKGTGDGLMALETVRAHEPAAQFQAFGVSVPEGFPGRCVERPNRTDVGAILRRSAIFICPSWEEGLGLPGIEALACGAGLATTDTKGSRDYASHEETALVSAPHDPDALAQNVLRLLRDPLLRGQLARAGQERVATVYPSWPISARGFEAALKRLI